VHTDDTGWRVRGEPAFLMALETDTAIGSHVRPRHRHEAVQEVIPVDYEGVMVTDRGRRDDAQAFDEAGTTLAFPVVEFSEHSWTFSANAS
jgi:hypothetical protein